MAYKTDNEQEEFTEGQQDRIYTYWDAYRASWQ